MTLPRVKASTNSCHSDDLVGDFQVLKEVWEYIYLIFFSSWGMRDLFYFFKLQHSASLVATCKLLVSAHRVHFPDQDQTWAPRIGSMEDSVCLKNIYLFIIYLGAMGLSYDIQAPEHAGSVASMHGLTWPMACGISLPQSGVEPTFPSLEGRFLTTEPPGKSQGWSHCASVTDFLLDFILCSLELTWWLSDKECAC